jgi:glycosyltransferase involved in cell wall biosynthesis
MDRVPSSMTSVIIYKECLLNASETFIAEQVGAFRRFRPKYVALTRPERCLSFEGERLYLNDGVGRFARWRVGLYRRIPVAPLFHEQIRDLRACLIHAHFAQDGLQALRLSNRLSVPLIVTLHGADVTVRQNFPGRYRTLWDEASLFLCVSRFIRAKAIDAGFPPGKLVVHRIGIDSRKFLPSSAPKGCRVVLFVGRLVEKKGCEVLLRAMAIVCATVPDALLVIIGDGPLRHPLGALASALSIDATFLGTQAPADVHSWMQKATVFCVPSQRADNGDSEGLGMVFLEAQACGIPVVSTLHGGIPEAVENGETGLLAPEGNVQALAQALIAYLLDSELAERHGAAGRARVVREFDLHEQTACLEGIYESVVCSAALPTAAA